MGCNLRHVGVEAEALKWAGQEAELLEVAELPALGVGRAGVGAREDGVTDEFAFIAVVRAGSDGTDVEVGDDDVVEALVEPAHRDAAGGVEVVFEREIPVLGLGGLQVGIAEGDRLIGVVKRKGGDVIG